jgi:hypothetical protein
LFAALAVLGAFSIFLAQRQPGYNIFSHLPLITIDEGQAYILGPAVTWLTIVLVMLLGVVLWRIGSRLSHHSETKTPEQAEE